MKFNFNFQKGSLDFLKKISKNDIFIFLLFLGLVFSFFKDEIKQIIPVLSQIPIQQDIYKEGVKDEIELEKILNKMITKHDVDFIHLNLFHNGTVSPSGYHFKKFSCAAEGKREDRLPRIHKIQGWLISPIKNKLNMAESDGHVYLPDLHKDKDVYFSKEVTKHGIESLFYVGLFDHRKKDSSGKPHFIGFICYEWERPTDFQEKDLVAMEKEKERLMEFILK